MIATLFSTRYNVYMDALHLQEYLERISNLLRSETHLAGAKYALQPIQLSALHYLSRSNRYSNTPQAVTEYFGLTKGTVSQTLKALERKNLISKKTDEKDRRVVHMTLTQEGQKALDHTLPAQIISKALKDLHEKEGAQLLAQLKSLLRSMQAINGMRTFGQCRTCRYNKKTGPNEFFCELTRETLSQNDVTLICREHENPENSDPRHSGISM